MASPSGSTSADRPSVPRTARERARAEITREILAAARRHVASDGASSLSVRAVARELGMASSALYRYVASRDDLLTRLIVEAYDSLGAKVEAAEARVERADLVARFGVLCESVRAWALDHPHEYALIFGSPVPGYVAPSETVGPASRVPLVLVQIVADAVSTGAVSAAAGESIPPEVADALAPVRDALGEQVPVALLARGLRVWTAVFGMVSFELFGQLHNVVGEGPGQRAAFFAECVRRWAADLGLADRPGSVGGPVRRR